MSNKQATISTRTLKSNLVLCTAAIMAASAIGCASDSNTGDSVDDTQQLQAPSSAPVVLRDPNGTYFAEVKANGTGCPAGTWNTSLSDDGKTFTTTFSAYEAQVDAQTMISVKDCQLAIKLHSPQGMSYSVQSFHYTGYAYLEKGVSARQQANYYFQGNPVLSDRARTNMVGEFDDAYLFTDNVEIADMVWSPCGLDRDLNVTTRLRLQNSNPKRSGYINLTAVDGEAKLVLQLQWRTCNPTTANATPPITGGRTLTP